MCIHLHGHDGAQDVEGRVGDVEAVGEAARDGEGQHVDGDDVDDEDVAACCVFFVGGVEEG